MVLSIVHRPQLGGSGWETNPPRPATRPATGVEDQEAHRDLTTPTCKDNREEMVLQVGKREGNLGYPFRECKQGKLYSLPCLL
jgi:hypothetical protein